LIFRRMILDVALTVFHVVRLLLIFRKMILDVALTVFHVV